MKIAVALLVLPLLLGCGCCEGPALILDEIFGGPRHTFTEQDLVGDWSSDCGGTVSIRADGTATVTGLPIRRTPDAGGNPVDTEAGGEFTWKIVPESADNDQEVRFEKEADHERDFKAHAERDWSGFDNLEYYLSTPSDPIYCVLSK